MSSGPMCPLVRYIFFTLGFDGADEIRIKLHRYINKRLLVLLEE